MQETSPSALSSWKVFETFGAYFAMLIGSIMANQSEEVQSRLAMGGWRVAASQWHLAKRQILFFNPPTLPPLNEHTHSPWKGSIAFPTHLRSEQGAEARGPLSIVSRVVQSSQRDYINHISKHRFSFNAVSQFELDTAAALATIREWRSSLVPINRLPMEVLSLIPTHLSNEGDLFRASYVCRYWRSTFIERAGLWSNLDLKMQRSDLYVKTLLERAQGSALDISSARLDDAKILALLSPHALKFRTLDFVEDSWPYIQMFSEATAGPLPLLHTLGLDVIDLGIDSETAAPPLLPLFSGAVNLKNFVLHSEGEVYLKYFIFPNLTTFELSATTYSDEFLFSQLLDFLEASPTLQTVRIRIVGGMEAFQGDIPPDRVAVLPNVETLLVTRDEPGYEIAAHISCPSARLASFVREYDGEYGVPEGIFPTSTSWNAIGSQHMASTIDEVVLGITAEDDILFYSLSLLSPGLDTLKFGYRGTIEDEDDYETPDSLEEEHSRIFSQAFEAVRHHPLLNNVKRLRIQDQDRDFPRTPHYLAHITEEATQLFKTVGPLEELILDVDYLRPFISPFFDPPELQVLSQPYTFHSIQVLTIIEHPARPLGGECLAAIVGLVKSQHMRGVPFERVVLHMELPSVGMAEKLEPWVGAVHFSEVIVRDDQSFMEL